MRLSRRAALGWSAGALATSLGSALGYRALQPPRGSDEVRSVTVKAAPLGPLLPSEPGRSRFGDLVFRSGLVLTSDDPGFGGWSSLWRSPDGTRMVSVSDNAQWLTTGLRLGGGVMAGFADAVMAPVLGRDGVPLRHTEAFDTESLAIADGTAFVGSERVHEVRRFDWVGLGVRALGVPVKPLPPEIAGLPFNQGLEALAVAPAGHALAGALLAVAEGEFDDDTPTRGWVLTGADRFTFPVRRSEGFNVTDMAFLPSGELLVLERHFSVRRGVACRIRRVAADAIRPGVALDGRVIFQADRHHAIDNMEGLTIHRDPDGATILTIISDDNFSPIQTTVLLEFKLDA